jgi:hypothetical protein
MFFTTLNPLLPRFKGFFGIQNRIHSGKKAKMSGNNRTASISAAKVKSRTRNRRNRDIHDRYLSRRDARERLQLRRLVSAMRVARGHKP